MFPWKGGKDNEVFKIIRNLSFNSYVTTLVCDPLWASEPAGVL